MREDPTKIQRKRNAFARKRNGEISLSFAEKQQSHVPKTEYCFSNIFFPEISRMKIVRFPSVFL